MTHLLKTTSLLAIAAAAAALASSASAADLGGNCCTDLEERVAELEATTARKGNRKVSLQIYGQVSEEILAWNDGGEKNVFVAENRPYANIIGFQGNAKINSDWSAGFKLEMEVRVARSDSLNQKNLGDMQGVTVTTYNTQSLALRHAYWQLSSNTYGTISVGQQAEVIAGVASINLANPDGHANAAGDNAGARGMFLRVKNAPNSGPGNGSLSALKWSNVDNAFGDGDYAWDAARSPSINYVSPFFLGQTKSSGFQFSAGWGADDYWDTALRYAEEFGAIRLAAGVGYRNGASGGTYGSCYNPAQGATSAAPTPTSAAVSSAKCDNIEVGASAMHTPTGLYITGSYAQSHDSMVNDRMQGLAVTAGSQFAGYRSPRDTQYGYYLQGGWEAKLNALGKTTFWTDYEKEVSGAGIYSNGLQLVSSSDVLAKGVFGGNSIVDHRTMTVWGLGVTQAIDAAAMNLFLGYKNISADVFLTDGKTVAKSNAVSDFSVIYSGATIKF